MDNITHSLVGAALAETGLKRWTPLATATLIIGANFPDIDIVIGLKSSLAYLEHHRGITHAIVAIPFLSLILAGLMAAFSHWRRRKNPALETARFGRLFVLSLLSMSTHPLLDFTNSYGWRPFLPWNRDWYYGDIDFVADPWLWVGLGGALVLVTAYTNKKIAAWSCLFILLTVPVMFFAGADWSLKTIWLLLVAAVFGLRVYWQDRRVLREKFVRGVLVIVLLYFSSLIAVQQFALQQASAMALMSIAPAEQLIQIDAMPMPANSLRWKAVIATEDAFYFTDLFLLSQAQPAWRRYARQTGATEFIEAALAEPDAQTFLRFARFPVIVAQSISADVTQVEIRDARFFDPANAVNSTFLVRILFDPQKRRIMDK